jgi:tetratricopeptide (TPR) repeat protein
MPEESVMHSERQRFDQLVFASRDLPGSVALELEKHLEDDPDDFETRVRLIGFYFRARYESPQLRRTRLRHVTWFVDHHPGDPLLDPYAEISRDLDGRLAYVRLKNRWIDQVKAHDREPGVMLNAARFFIPEEPYLSQLYLKKAQQLEPEEGRWAHELSMLYTQWGLGYEQLAFEECARALKHRAGTADAFTDLVNLPKFALAAGDITKATEAADALLLMPMQAPDHWLQGEVLQSAHTTLGRIALVNGDIESAKGHLLQSVSGTSSPRTASYGPDRELAAELLQRGQTDVVLEWMNRCEQIWAGGRNQIDHWRKVMAQGVSPFDYLLPQRRKFFHLTKRPRAAYNRGDYDAAQKFADQLLSSTQHSQDDRRHLGYALHVGHVVLGQLELKRGDKKAAREHLMLAADIPTSDRLRDHGADLSLAADMVLAFEKSAALEFAEKMDPYWKDDWLQADEWIAAVAAGEIDTDLLW